MIKWMIALLLAAALLGGCSKGSSSGGGDGNTAATADAIGVTECDEYLAKMEACLSKMPPEARSALEANFKQTRASWKELVQNPAGKEGLKATCKAALDALAANPACK